MRYWTRSQTIRNNANQEMPCILYPSIIDYINILLDQHLIIILIYKHLIIILIYLHLILHFFSNGKAVSLLTMTIRTLRFQQFLTSTISASQLYSVNIANITGWFFDPESITWQVDSKGKNVDEVNNCIELLINPFHLDSCFPLSFLHLSPV